MQPAEAVKNSPRRRNELRSAVALRIIESVNAATVEVLVALSHELPVLGRYFYLGSVEGTDDRPVGRRCVVVSESFGNLAQRQPISTKRNRLGAACALVDTARVGRL
ncbi:hypothetical protein VX037_11625 [Gordonia sp. Z-3]|uniref:hypothetical protein n=1 Tax=Gordonia sp. Z-3 TaxID=3115408 RepID=UPI002E2B93C8|nr:hypothetical protein [Gordonia sp. Z-3]MED5801677.1 hypothetical protein [Gordonia sp. Z-3]